MAGAFNNAWMLLKNRGFEVDPRYEDERMQRLEQGYDERYDLLGNLRDVYSRLQRGGDFHDNKDLAEREDLENELYQLMRNPEGARYGDPPMNMIEAQTGPMFQEQQRQEAEDIEAEGVDLPDGPRVSAVPPVNVGRAGSSNPARVRPIDVFSPAGVKLQQEQQRVRSQLKPILSEEELMRPPVQKSFDSAWSVLKEDPLKTRSDQLAQTPLGQALAAARAKKPQPLDFTPRDDQGQELQYFPEDQEPMTHTEMVQAYGPDFQERFGDRVNPFQVSVEELKRRQQQGEQQ